MSAATKTIATSILLLIAVIVGGAFAVLYFEGQTPDANMHTLSDALWWALNVSSVGDASLHPITNGGRIVGATLIVVGYAIFTVNVSMLSAHFMRLIKTEE